nr:MAG TPA: hypothetical protein [Caudoviricetes sp.]
MCAAPFFILCTKLYPIEYILSRLIIAKNKFF